MYIRGMGMKFDKVCPFCLQAKKFRVYVYKMKLFLYAMQAPRERGN
jgi:hypothetical protein